MLISEPTATGGLALLPEPLLLHAGVVAVGHMCRTVTLPDGSRQHDFRESYAAARRTNPRLPNHGAVAKAWERQLQRLRECGAAPVEAELASSVEGDGKATTAIAAAMRADGAPPTEKVVDAVAVEELLAAVPVVGSRRSKEVWARLLRRCFPSVEPCAAEEWNHGSRNRARHAKGARMIFVLDGERSAAAEHGEARWLKRRNASYVPPVGDEAGLSVGDDGYLVGHEAETQRLLAMMDFDAEGFAVGPDGHRIEASRLGDLPPALQLQARARMELPTATPVVDEWPAEKTKESRVNLAVQRRNRVEYATWQARIGATSAWALDGTRQVIKHEKAPWEYVNARASVRHDGFVQGGRLDEPEGADNYIDELAAQIDMALAEDRGARVIVTFDAVSPLKAARRFRRACNRRKQGYYVGSWLSALLRLLDRCEVVVFLWQKSHVGSPPNEWVDRLADIAAEGDAVLPVPRMPVDFASLRPSRPRKSTSKWAAPLAKAAVVERLSAAVGDTLLHGEEHLPALALPDNVCTVCDAVLSQRSCLADGKRHRGRIREAALAGRPCPFGCKLRSGVSAPFTWVHAQIFCSQKELVSRRRTFAEAIGAAEHAWASGKADHMQMSQVKRLASLGLPAAGTRSGAVAAERPLQSYEERDLRAFVGGLVMRTMDRHADASSEYRAALVKAVVAGARVQQKAHELTAEIEAEVEETVRGLARARLYATRWRRITAEAGPARTAALRAVRAAEVRAYEMLVALTQDGCCTADEAETKVDERCGLSPLSVRRARGTRRVAMLRTGTGAGFGDWHGGGYGRPCALGGAGTTAARASSARGLAQLTQWPVRGSPRWQRWAPASRCQRAAR